MLKGLSSGIALGILTLLIGCGSSPSPESSTQSPLVALYALKLASPATWRVEFGKDTKYGLTTGNVVSQTPNQVTSTYVAGMLPNTTYHMRAIVTFDDGTTKTESDHTFTTGALPTGIPASLPVKLGTGTPQPGIELINSISGPVPSTVYAADLQGNVIWAYPYADRTSGTLIYPVKLLPTGNFIAFLSPLSYPLGSPGVNYFREFDLAGNTIRQLSMADLNTALANAGFSVTLQNFSHDFVLLPNGHYLLIANTEKTFTNVTGVPGVSNVVGDVVVDLDAKWNPVWIWNEFDHFDVNRHPMGFPDWTHSNSIAYSPDDGNFIVSMRHQNWVVKVDYRNGQGGGDVLWRLGQAGDFTLKGGVDPVDWFYAQHDVTFSSPSTSGVFSLTVMDNGDDREFLNTSCGVEGARPCLYTTIQNLEIDEAEKTATFKFHQILAPSLYSNFGGNVDILGNGNTEYTLSAPTGGGQIFEVTTSDTPEMVWHLTTPSSYDYRGFRIPSLYPGVQW
jgi:arylsulfate sulfotransferase